MANTNAFNKLFKEIFEEINKNIDDFFSIGSIVSSIASQTKEAVAELKDLDTALTEIGRTTGLTKQQLKELGDSAFDAASKYGKTASDYLSSIQELYHAGFQDTKGIAELLQLPLPIPMHQVRKQAVH